MKFVLTVLFICYFLGTYAQSDSTQILDYDTSYIHSYYKDWCVTTSAFFPTAFFNLAAEKYPKSIIYHSNLPVGLGITLDYKWFGLTYSNNISYINLYDRKYPDGITKQRSLQLGYTGRRFWARLAWQNFRGFYLVNADELQIKGKDISANYFTRADLEMNAWFSYIYYAFNHKKYSHIATLWQLDQQLKSAGSPLIGLSINSYTVSGDSSFIPIPLAQQLESASSKKQSTNIFLMGGYSYTFVAKQRFFANINLNMGIGYQKKTAEDVIFKPESPYFNYAVLSEANFVVGYNGKRMYGGLSTEAKAFWDNFEKGALHNYSFGMARFFIGFRIRN